MEHQHASEAKVTRIQTINAVVVRACKGQIARFFGAIMRECQAPGTWQKQLTARELAVLPPSERNTYGWRIAKWPQVFTDDPMLIGQTIEGNCPCCGTPRPQAENRGEVFRREFH